MTQLRSSWPHVMSPWIAAVTIRALPVNSSVPSMMTMIRPTGNSRPETRRTIAALSRPLAAVELTTAPKPMSMPAPIPNTNNLLAGAVAFPMEACIYPSVMAFGELMAMPVCTP